MNKPKILVTAAGGKTGAATTLLLLEQDHPVRAMVHREDARSHYLIALEPIAHFGLLAMPPSSHHALLSTTRADNQHSVDYPLSDPTKPTTGRVTRRAGKCRG
jgi:NAD(P)H dehydrogenase (quinone)